MDLRVALSPEAYELPWGIQELMKQRWRQDQQKHRRKMQLVFKELYDSIRDYVVGEGSRAVMLEDDPWLRHFPVIPYTIVEEDKKSSPFWPMFSGWFYGGSANEELCDKSRVSRPSDIKISYELRKAYEKLTAAEIGVVPWRHFWPPSFDDSSPKWVEAALEAAIKDKMASIVDYYGLDRVEAALIKSFKDNIGANVDDNCQARLEAAVAKAFKNYLAANVYNFRLDRAENEVTKQYLLYLPSRRKFYDPDEEDSDASGSDNEEDSDEDDSDSDEPLGRRGGGPSSRGLLSR